MINWIRQADKLDQGAGVADLPVETVHGLLYNLNVAVNSRVLGPRPSLQ